MGPWDPSTTYCEHGMLHTPVLVWVSYFQKDDGQKLIKNTNKDTRVSTQQTFFVPLSVHAMGKTNTMKIEYTFTNNDDKDDKDDKHFSVQVK